MASIKTIIATAPGSDNQRIKIQAGKHLAIVDQPESLGDSDQRLSPIVYVFVALADCIIKKDRS